MANVNDRNTVHVEPKYMGPAWVTVSEDAKDCVKRIFFVHLRDEIIIVRIIGMLCKDPKKRITIKELLRHPWLTKNCKEVREMREHSKADNMFKNYVLQVPHTVKIFDEIQKRAGKNTL